eukprot:gb/GECG01008003.1/.p1 GENE.gb/GECG01008003.1/~~gb/GECG01008003.1/.p1  ORF type:complete len:203 (+),score=34.24 gb/GECG01008003.1/:1-609(+)
MAGVKRQTPYRKNVTQEVLEGHPEPDESRHQVIARIVEPRGSNIFEVETPKGRTGLCLLPTKFRKLVWIKRGDFVIASEAEGDYDTKEGSGRGKVTFQIDNILFPEQIKHLQHVGKWPDVFPTNVKQKPPAAEADDRAPYTAGGYIDDSSFFHMAEEMGGNPNRKPLTQDEDSDDDTSSSEEEDEDDEAGREQHSAEASSNT